MQDGPKGNFRILILHNFFNVKEKVAVMRERYSSTFHFAAQNVCDPVIPACNTVSCTIIPLFGQNFLLPSFRNAIPSFETSLYSMEGFRSRRYKRMLATDLDSKYNSTSMKQHTNV